MRKTRSSRTTATTANCPHSHHSSCSWLLQLLLLCLPVSSSRTPTDYSTSSNLLHPFAIAPEQSRRIRHYKANNKRRLQQVVTVSRPGEDEAAPPTQLPTLILADTTTQAPTTVPTTTTPASTTTMAPTTVVTVTSTLAPSVTGSATNTVQPEISTASSETPTEEILVIGVTFEVASTSNLAQQSVDPSQLLGVLQAFVTTLLDDWAYRRRRRRLVVVTDSNSNSNLIINLRGNSNDKNDGVQHFGKEDGKLLQLRQQQQQLDDVTHNDNDRQPNNQPRSTNHYSRRRRLQVSLVDASVHVNDPLVPSQDCIVSINNEEPYDFCYKAHGRFQVKITEEENPDTVCRNMQEAVNDLMLEGALQTSLESLYGDTSNLQVQPGAMEFCEPLEEWDDTLSNATTATTPSTATAAPSTQEQNNNIFDQSEAPGDNTTSNGTNSTTDGTTNAPTVAQPTPAPAATLAPSVPPAPSATPGGEKPFVNEWLQVLEETTGSGKNNKTTPAPSSSSYNGARNYTAEMEALRAALWDDSELDFVVMIVGIVLASLCCLVCCCYWTDVCYLTFTGGYDEEDEFDDDDGDEHVEYEKDINGELEPLHEDEDEYYDEDDEGENGNNELGSGSMYMSESEEFEEGYAADEFEEGDDVEGSGDFYVSGDDEDVFDEDGDEEIGESLGEQSDYFHDEVQDSPESTTKGASEADPKGPETAKKK